MSWYTTREKIVNQMTSYSRFSSFWITILNAAKLKWFIPPSIHSRHSYHASQSLHLEYIQATTLSRSYARLFPIQYSCNNYNLIDTMLSSLAWRLKYLLQLNDVMWWRSTFYMLIPRQISCLQNKICFKTYTIFFTAWSWKGVIPDYINSGRERQ